MMLLSIQAIESQAANFCTLAQWKTTTTKQKLACMSSISAQKSIINLTWGHSYLHMKRGQCSLNQCSLLNKTYAFLNFIILFLAVLVFWLLSLQATKSWGWNQQESMWIETSISVGLIGCNVRVLYILLKLHMLKNRRACISQGKESWQNVVSDHSWWWGMKINSIFWMRMSIDHSSDHRSSRCRVCFLIYPIQSKETQRC